MTDLTPAQERGLAEQALENLVHQFARPLDFLRELVQNAIDAGTPRVEVWTRFAPPADGEELGVLEIHVDDFGEGMDEAIIDSQLTRMFSSTKEDDRTKIGKFGIGFTSVFAIQPDAILLRTGRHGESWELLFHPDRSFDKVRVDEPIAMDALERMDEGLLMLRHHPAFQSNLAALNADAALGVYGLAQSVLHACGFRHPRRYRALMAFCTTAISAGEATS